MASILRIRVGKECLDGLYSHVIHDGKVVERRPGQPSGQGIGLALPGGWLFGLLHVSPWARGED
jgi:hypothetical protein